MISNTSMRRKKHNALIWPSKLFYQNICNQINLFHSVYLDPSKQLTNVHFHASRRIKNVQDQLKNLHINRANGEENLHEEEETHEYLIKSFDRILNQIAATFDAN